MGYTATGNIVFDVRSYKDDCRLIDPLHLLLQFGYKIRDEESTICPSVAVARRSTGFPNPIWTNCQSSTNLEPASGLSTIGLKGYGSHQVSRRSSHGLVGFWAC